MVGILDEPLADPACLNVLFISEAARSSGIKVLLSGIGGDDLFAGYRRHTLLAAGPIWDTIPSGIRQAIVRMATGWKPEHSAWTSDRENGLHCRTARR